MNIVLIQALSLYFAIGALSIAIVWLLRLCIDYIEEKNRKEV